MDIIKQKLKSALATQNYRIYCEIFEELSGEEISRLARLYKVDPASPRRVICEKLVEVLKSKFVSLPNEIINKVMMESSSGDIKRWKEFDRMNEKTYFRKKNSTLMEAASEGNLVGIEYLLQKGADLKKEGFPALLAAAASGRLDIVRYLVEKGVDMNSGEPYTDNDLLLVVIKNGHLDILKYLLDNGIVLSMDESVILTIASPHLDMVKFLIKRYKSELDYAYIYDAVVTKGPSKEFLQIILDGGVDVNSDEGKNLAFAINNKNDEVIEFLLQKGADPVLAFMAATGYSDDTYTISYLLEKGLVDDSHIPEAFLSACRWGSKVIEMLIGRVDQETKNRGLLEAIRGDIKIGRFLEVVNLLIKNGADVNAQEGEALFTALDSYSYSYSTDDLIILIEKGADINIRGGKLLEQAVLNEVDDFVKILLENDAKITKQALEDAMRLAQDQDDNNEESRPVKILKMLKEKIISDFLKE
jgi:ankyrin repeat protein